MSVTATSQGNSSGRAHWSEPLGVRIMFLSVTAVVVSFLGTSIAHGWQAVANNLPILAVWIAIAAVADLMPVELWGDVTLSMSLPITLAAGMVLAPWSAGLIAFLAALDLREFQGEVSFARGLYNRSQIAASVVLASMVFHALHGNPLEWPRVIAVGLAALAVDWGVNLLLISLAVAMMTRLSIGDVLRRVHGDDPLDHGIGYLCLGLLAVLLSTLYEVAGGWGLLAALFPLALARQMFKRGRRLEDAARKLAAKDRALVGAAEQTLSERRDERLAVAGELHDEVLPPLFKVHLMGQVLRQDLNSGRLLDLDEDVPQLITATEIAQSAIRGLMRNLRRSSIGPAGLNATLELLARQLEAAGSPSIRLELGDVGGSSVSQLLAYQVAREAMNNAARHSRATWIAVRLFREADRIRLIVEDDGVGFDPCQVDASEHFGLQLMAERVEAGRGRMVVDSLLGRGTRILTSLPLEL